MGVLDSNKVITTPNTGLEGTNFNLVCSNDNFDMWAWRAESVANGTDGAFLRVTFRDIFVWSNNDVFDNALFMVKGSITDKPTRIVVDDVNFPNLRKNSSGKFPFIVRVFAVPTDFLVCWGNIPSENQWEKNHGTRGQHCRINVVFENGQIYHNYPACYNTCDFYGGENAWINPNNNRDRVKLDSLFTKFEEGCVWDMADRKIPTNDQSLVSTGAYYYNPTLPIKCYEMHPAISVGTGYSNTQGYPSFKKHKDANGIEHTYARFFMYDRDAAECNSLTWMGGYAMDNKFTMIATYNSSTSVACRMCVFATDDGGRNWYNIYEFAGNPRIRLHDKLNAPTNIKGVPMSLDGTSLTPSDWKVRYKAIIVPTTTDKEPSAIFEYGDEINVISIVGSNGVITITTSVQHGFMNGDHVHFKGSSVSSDLNFMLNNSANGNSGGNGVFFIVQNVSSNTFTITLDVYNPNSGLPIRHIHALNRCKDGVSISTGELYPQGWIVYGAILQADTYAYWHPWLNDINWVRLNSTQNSIQRPLGVIVQQETIDGVADTMIYYGADNEFTPMGSVTMPEGRTQTFSHNSTGVYKFRLSDIDNAATAECIFAERENCYMLQKIDNALVFTGQFGAVAVSYDDGKTWSKAHMPKDLVGEKAQFSGMTFDRKLSIGNILIQLKK